MQIDPDGLLQDVIDEQLKRGGKYWGGIFGSAAAGCLIGGVVLSVAAMAFLEVMGFDSDFLGKGLMIIGASLVSSWFAFRVGAREGYQLACDSFKVST